jgi:hypothetical protein
MIIILIIDYHNMGLYLLIIDRALLYFDLSCFNYFLVERNLYLQTVKRVY